MNVTKGNIAILNEKRSNDIHLIETLNNRLKTTEIKHEERETDTRNRSEKIEREYTNLKNDLQSAQLQIDRLRKKLEEREIEIDKLRFSNFSIFKKNKKYKQIFYRNILLILGMERSPIYGKLNLEKLHNRKYF